LFSNFIISVRANRGEKPPHPPSTSVEKGVDRMDELDARAKTAGLKDELLNETKAQR
jgi:hypothetical protein